jgi:hypothetical protein
MLLYQDDLEQAQRQSSLQHFPTQDAIDLSLGESFYLDVRKPILDARSIELQRGAGFYYDRCIAVRMKHDVSVILVDKGSHQLLRKDFGERGRIDFRLAMFNEKGPL